MATVFGAAVSGQEVLSRALDIFIHDYLGTSKPAPLIALLIFVLVWLLRRDRELTWRQWRLQVADAWNKSGKYVFAVTLAVYALSLLPPGPKLSF